MTGAILRWTEEQDRRHAKTWGWRPGDTTKVRCVFDFWWRRINL